MTCLITFQGFATFAEDFIHSRAMQSLYQAGKRESFAGYPLRDDCIDSTFSWKELAQLRGLIRYQTLIAELEATPDDHQIIRPMGGKDLRDDATQITYVKNGQNPEMAYTQVHYLKGYFLLHYLCENVGEDSFFILLRHYIHDLYHGQLVNSLDFLTLYFAKHFSPASSCEHEENVNKICNDWLDTKELHPSVARKYTTLSGPMLDAVELAARVWVNDYGKIRKRAKSSIKKASSINTIQSNAYKLLPEQIVLFLEKLLSSDVMINNEGLSALWIKFQFDKCNADIQHRWCELVVKHRFSDGFPFIKKFLQDHQAMGIYLYGEMALLKHKKLHTLAMDTFNELRSEMDPSTIDNVSQILSG